MVRSSFLSKIMSNECAPPSPSSHAFQPIVCFSWDRHAPGAKNSLSADSLLKSCIFNVASPTILFLVFPCAFQNVVFIFFVEHKSWLRRQGEFICHILYQNLKGNFWRLKKPKRCSKVDNVSFQTCNTWKGLGRNSVSGSTCYRRFECAGKLILDSSLFFTLLIHSFIQLIHQILC